MPQGNTYPAPQLPLTGEETIILFQQRGLGVATCTATLSALVALVPQVASVALVTGAGSTQDTATLLSATVNRVTSATQGSGVRLAAPSAQGVSVQVQNRSDYDLNVYPPLGGNIENGALDAPVLVPASGALILTFFGDGLWSAS